MCGVVWEGRCRSVCVCGWGGGGGMCVCMSECMCVRGGCAHLLGTIVIQ